MVSEQVIQTVTVDERLLHPPDPAPPPLFKDQCGRWLDVDE